MKFLLIADSPDFDTAYIVKRHDSFDRIMVTDGAVHKLPPGVTPHIVCGDFDSLDLPRAEAAYPMAEFLFLEDQNLNDLEKGLELCFSLGAQEVVIASGLGGMLDISIAALSIMIRHHQRCSISMVKGSIVCRVLSDATRETSMCTFSPSVGAQVSCLPLVGKAMVSMSNVAWELDKGELRSGSHGVSNKAVGGPVTVTVHQGLVLLCYHIEV